MSVARAQQAHSTLNTQHSTLNTQHSTLNTRHSTLNTQHSTLNTQAQAEAERAAREEGQALACRQALVEVGAKGVAQGGWRDGVTCDDKQCVNALLAAYHGPPGQQFDPGTKALFLDGDEMQTTETLLEWGWMAGNMHVPNCAAADYLAIQEKSAQGLDGRLNVTHQTSTSLLENAAAQPYTLNPEP